MAYRRKDDDDLAGTAPIAETLRRFHRKPAPTPTPVTVKPAAVPATNAGKRTTPPQGRNPFLTRKERDAAEAAGETDQEKVARCADLAFRIIGMVATAPTPEHRKRAATLALEGIETLACMALRSIDYQATTVTLATSNLMGREGNQNAARAVMKSAAKAIARERQASFVSTHGHPPTDRWLAEQVHKQLCRQFSEHDQKIYSPEHIRKRILPALRT
jgi:hypothetical protein